MMRIFFIISVLIAFQYHVEAQEQISNSNFEDWEDAHNAQGWNSYSIDLIFASYHTANRTTDAASGDYAVELITQDVVGETLPGLVMLGEIDFDTFEPYGGIPFTSRPTGFSFSYKYAPAGNDQAVAALLLTRWNEETQTADSVGAGIYIAGETQNDFSRVMVPVYYQLALEPDTINIGFVSSLDNPQIGSALIVDDLELSYELTDYPTLCFPAYNLQSKSYTAAWAPIPHAEGYSLEVSYDSNFSELVGGYPQEFENSYNLYANIEVPETGLYYHRVKVLYEESESVYSNYVAAALPTIAYDADAVQDMSFSANWQAVSDASDFLLTVASDADFDNMLAQYTDISVGIGGSYTASGLEAESEYFYRLKTVYGDIISPASNAVSVVTQTLNAADRYSSDIQIYTQGTSLTVEVLNERTPFQLEIYDLSGRMIKQQKMHNNKSSLQLPGSGIYLMIIRNEDKLFVRKIPVL